MTHKRLPKSPFGEFEHSLDAINSDLIAVIHLIKALKILSTPVALLVNIINLKVVSEAKNSVF